MTQFPRGKSSGQIFGGSIDIHFSHFNMKRFNPILFLQNIDSFQKLLSISIRFLLIDAPFSYAIQLERGQIQH